ncbi:MAG: GumC family protein [Alphaproteobacteria bacterium]
MNEILSMRTQATVPGRGDDGLGIDLRQQIGVLWRRRRLILGVVLGVILATWLGLMRFTPIYAGSASVMIENRKTRFLDLKEVITTSQPQLTTVLSEVEVIRSRNVAERVADNLDLYKDPEFNPSLRAREGGLLTLLREFIAQLSKPSVPEPSPGEKERAMRAAVVTGLLARVSANPVPQSMVINIQVRSEDPAKASLLTNTLAEQYVLDQLNAKFEATRNASVWLSRRLETLRTSVAQAERAVAAFRASSGLIDSKGVLPTHQQLAELNTQLIQIQGRRSELQAKVAHLETLIQSNRGAEAADEVVESPLIQRLREQETTLMREVSDMSTRYGEMHPKMIKGNAELAELRSKINTEIAKLSQALRNEHNVARARESAIQERIRKLDATVVEQNRSEVRLHELEREAQSSRTLYENFLNRFKETSEQEQIQQPDARIISRSERPVSPAFPRKGLILGVMSIGGLLLGTILALVLERLDNTFRSREELENATGLPAIGMIPFVDKKPVAQYLLDRPTSAFAEALRGLWISLCHNDPAATPKVVAITSSFPDEGKSMTALSLARTVAILGHRVVLVDCDLRRSAVARLLEITPTHFVDEILEGKIDIATAMIRDTASTLHVLPARNVERPPLDMLGSTVMKDFLSTLQRDFDLVLLDCPPVMPVSEAQILGRLADKTVFCVLWDRTPREAVSNSLRQLRDVQVDMAGTILTKVHLKKHARYGYGDIGHYYGRYKGYYAD